MQLRDIIVVGLQPWGIKIGSNCKNIAIEFAKNNRVLYVNSPMDLNTLRKKNKLKERKKGLEQVAENIWVLTPSKIILSANWLPFTAAFKLINKWNNKRFAGDINRAIKELGFRNFMLFNDSDMFRSFHLKELLNPVIDLYYTRDNLLSQQYWHKHGHIIEPEIMRKSTLVVANSVWLAEIAKCYNHNSFDVGQGCDLTVFDHTVNRNRPDDLPLAEGPIIGYIGALSSLRLDIDLLVKLCSTKPEWTFVFVGNEDAAFEKSALHDLRNVFFLGSKKEKELPDYLAGFDVAINPQAVNELTIGNYPRKIDEYLALGKPVVATDTATMTIFSDVVYLSKSVQEYIENIKKAISENSSQLATKRIQVAQSHTWENSVAKIYDAIKLVSK